MYPEIYRIGPLVIRSYGIMLAISFIIGIYYAAYRGKKQDYKENDIMDIGLVILIASIVGSRLYYVMFHLAEYQDNLWRVFAIYEGGLSMYGGVILAIICGFTFMKIRKLPWWQTADILTIPMALGFSLTRIGCFFNGCCFGMPGDSYLCMVFPPNSAAGSVFPDQHIHPTQLYEAAYSFLIFAILYFWEKKPHPKGAIFWLFLLFYSISRFLIDFIRYYEKSMRIGGTGLSLNQVISIGLFIISLIILVSLYSKHEKIKSTEGNN
jgi:phosphatidylglycerol---prolipoprotein diacylglyceryl transferase